MAEFDKMINVPDVGHELGDSASVEAQDAMEVSVAASVEAQEMEGASEGGVFSVLNTFVTGIFGGVFSSLWSGSPDQSMLGKRGYDKIDQEMSASIPCLSDWAMYATQVLEGSDPVELATKIMDGVRVTLEAANISSIMSGSEQFGHLVSAIAEFIQNKKVRDQLKSRLHAQIYVKRGLRFTKSIAELMVMTDAWFAGLVSGDTDDILMLLMLALNSYIYVPNDYAVPDPNDPDKPRIKRSDFIRKFLAENGRPDITVIDCDTSIEVLRAAIGEVNKTLLCAPVKTHVFRKCEDGTMKKCDGPHAKDLPFIELLKEAKKERDNFRVASQGTVHGNPSIDYNISSSSSDVVEVIHPEESIRSDLTRYSPTYEFLRLLGVKTSVLVQFYQMSWAKIYALTYEGFGGGLYGPRTGKANNTHSFLKDRLPKIAEIYPEVKTIDTNYVRNLVADPHAYENDGVTRNVYHVMLDLHAVFMRIDGGKYAFELQKISHILDVWMAGKDAELRTIMEVIIVGGMIEGIPIMSPDYILKTGRFADLSMIAPLSKEEFEFAETKLTGATSPMFDVIAYLATVCKMSSDDLEKFMMHAPREGADAQFAVLMILAYLMMGPQ